MEPDFVVELLVLSELLVHTVVDPLVLAELLVYTVVALLLHVRFVSQSVLRCPCR